MSYISLRLERTLKRPIYDTALVLFPYEASGPNQLKLREGQRVIVISREGESMGWWKGRIADKVSLLQEFTLFLIAIKFYIFSDWLFSQRICESGGGFSVLLVKFKEWCDDSQ